MELLARSSRSDLEGETFPEELNEAGFKEGVIHILCVLVYTKTKHWIGRVSATETGRKCLLFNGLKEGKEIQASPVLYPELWWGRPDHIQRRYELKILTGTAKAD